MEEVTMSYDGSFEGYLSAIYDVYRLKVDPTSFDGKGAVVSLFASKLMVLASEEKSSRVLQGIISKSSKRTAKFIYEVFLSELPNIEIKLFHLIKAILKGQGSKIKDYSDSIIVDLHRVKKMVGREVHRMHAFVRFQETKDDMWVCEINPDFNVLPLIGKHFKDRYPTLEWVIFDTIRQYGIHFDGKGIHYITFDDKIKGRRITNEIITEDEKSYQSMWKQYFKSVNIEERNNEKLHLQHVPRRYWKYLIEKG